MKCPKCNFENPDNTHYCGNCGAPLMAPSDPSSPSTPFPPAPPSTPSPSSPPSEGTMTLPSYLLQLVPGKVFDGRYQVIEEIGAGGMGRVYKAVDLKVHETIALKLIHPEVAFKHKNIERFRNELRLTRKISHRNVCRMFDLHEGENAVYITMEYVQGEDLKNSLRMMGSFTIGKAVSIAKQICEGLKEAHHKGILHRDLKANNIILDREGSAHIMDFGIASSLETKGLTDNGVAIGTPTYMSPEQAGGKDMDHRSDIYSLGVILYELLTGEAPFKGDSSLTIAMKHKFDPPRPPIEINQRIPPALNRLILKCLEKKRENRYQSVDDILTDLRSIEDGLSTGEKLIPTHRMRATTIMTSIFTSLKTLKVPGYLVVGVALLAALIYVIGNIRRTPESQDRNIRIAVLPFEYLGPDQEKDHIWKILASEISYKLHNRYKNIITSPDASIEYFCKQGLNVVDIGQRLKVNHLITGKISIDRGAVGLSLALSDVNRNVDLFRTNKSCKLEDLFESVIDNFVLEIGSALRLTSDEPGRSGLQPSSDSILFYVLGRDAERMYLNTWDFKYLDIALEQYQAAYEIDPDYPLYSWLLGCVYEKRYVETDDLSERENMSGFFRRAYALDQNSAETNLGMGWEYFFQGDNDTAYLHFLRAFELDPNKFEINYNVAGFLRSVGLLEKAIKYYDLALLLNPGESISPALRTLPDGSALELRLKCLIEMGRFQEARDELESICEQVPDDPNLGFMRVNFYLRVGEREKAARELDRIRANIETDRRLPFYQAMVDAAWGEQEKSLALIKEGYPAPALVLVVQTYCALGMKPEAIRCIREGIEVGLPKVQTYMFTYQNLINNPFYDLLRMEPQFQDIVREQKTIYDAMVAKYRDL